MPSGSAIRNTPHERVDPAPDLIGAGGFILPSPLWPGARWPRLLDGRGGRRSARQRRGQLRNAVEPGAVVPQDLAPGRVIERQGEKFFHGLGKGPVRMRVIGRYDEIVRPELLDDIDRGLLVGVERQIALPFEIFARWQRQLMLAARAELFPLVVEPPEPPVEPAGSAFEKGAAQPGVAFEYAASGHAGDRTHQLNRIADRMRDRVEIGVAAHNAG